MIHCIGLCPNTNKLLVFGFLVFMSSSQSASVYVSKIGVASVLITRFKFLVELRYSFYGIPVPFSWIFIFRNKIFIAVGMSGPVTVAM